MSQTARRVTISIVRERPRPVELTPVKEVVGKYGTTKTVARSNSCDNNYHATWNSSFSPAASKTSPTILEHPNMSPPVALLRPRNFSLPNANYSPPSTQGLFTPAMPPLGSYPDCERYATSSQCSDDSEPVSPGGSLMSDAGSIDIINFAGSAAQQRRKRSIVT